jgi:hypothetical protein
MISLMNIVACLATRCPAGDQTGGVADRRVWISPRDMAELIMRITDPFR